MSFPSLKMRGQDKVETMLKELPYGAKKVVLPAVSEYIVGNETHGLKWYPQQTVQKYERTYELRESWTVVGDTYRERITNTSDHAPYPPAVWRRYGWRAYTDIVASNLAGALRHARAKLGEWLRLKGM